MTGKPWDARAAAWLIRPFIDSPRVRPGHRTVTMGAIAGVAVALIFHLRYLIEERHGKLATRQPRLGGFEAEDVLYLLPLVTLTGNLSGFLVAAAIGAPLAAIIVAVQYVRIMRVADA
jgi:hypothetical protein